MNRRGAVTLESALLGPLLVFGFLGTLDWSWYVFQNTAVRMAAQRGARIAAGVPSASFPEESARETARGWLRNQGIDTTAEVNVVTVTTSYGRVVEVEVTLPFEPLTGAVPTPTYLHGRATAEWYGDFGL